jgi:hypothetical protein
MERISAEEGRPPERHMPDENVELKKSRVAEKKPALRG